MASEELHRAIVAVQLALDAQTLDYQVRHAFEARRALEAGRRAIAARRDQARDLEEENARLIALRAAELDMQALEQFTETLRVVEARIAQALREDRDDDRRARLFADDEKDPRPI
jgi:hypothetical protein